MLFVSAVQAVSCSLEIQRDIHQNNLALGVRDRLQHRIGIHLGDVFLNGVDVLGDGVNIAARLQTAAQPGGVCVSHTVYDVVNNRVKFHINELGERKLKNIGKLKAYQISPLEGGPNSPGAEPPTQQKVPWLYYLGVSLAGFIVMLIVLGALKNKHNAAAKNSGITPSPVVATTAVPSPSVAPSPEQDETAKALSKELDNQKAIYLKKYDFKGLQAWIESHPHKEVPAYQLHAQLLASALDGISDLYTWWQGSFKERYSELHPLVINDKAGNKHTFYPDVSGEPFHKLNDGAPELTSYDEINPKVTIALIDKTVKEQYGLLNPERSHLEGELTLFRRAFLYPVQVESPTPQ
jgi:hypothetical protein